jgi:hypothetical protein
MENAALGRRSADAILRGVLPPGFEDHTLRSDRFRTFSILFDSSRSS